MDLRARLRALESRLGVGAAPARPAPAAPTIEADEACNAESESKPSLAARLQRLAARESTAPRHKPDLASIARALRGDVCSDGVIIVERALPLTHVHGRVPFARICEAPLDFFAGGVEPDRAKLLFIDTETTGLSGGTGTVAFVLGLARIRGHSVEVRQYLLTSFAGEAAMLAHALEWIAPDTHLVSFNGKSFDAPLLATRYLLALRRDPMAGLPHIDLLHRTRAAFARRWTDCRLQTAEQALLKLFRTDDVPGHLIPQIWTAWLQQGDTSGFGGVVEHNRIDLLSLIALAGVLAQTYTEPGRTDADPLGLARAHRRAGDATAARRHLEECGPALTDEARLELAALHAREAQWHKAVALWEQLAARNSYAAMERLAIYHEHRLRDYDAALWWTERMRGATTDSASVERRRSRLLRRREAGARASPVGA
jgi:uncharacterized protein YprB with RNaseH-like and TPR domain